MNALPPSRSVRQAVVMILLVVGMVAGGPVPSPGASTAAIQEPHFESDTFSDHRGDVVSVAVRVPNGSKTRVQFAPDGPNASDYVANVTVHDADGDGRVTVQFNTYAAGRGTLPTFHAAGDDAVLGSQEELVTGLLSAGPYSVAIARENGSLATPADEATVRVRPRSLEALRVHVSVNATSDLGTPRNVRAAMESGTLDSVPAFGHGDMLVMELRATGLAGALTVADGENATEQFLALGDGAVRGRLRERPETVTVEADPIVVPFDDRDVVHVLPDTRNDTYYLVVNVSAFVAEYGSAYRTGLFESGDLFHGNVTLAGDSRLVEGRETVRSERVEFVQRTATVEPASTVYVAPEGNQTIGGRANFGPGRTLTVVASTTGPTTFEFRQTATVDDGRFEATFDFSGVPAGTEFQVDVRFRNRSVLDGTRRTVVRDDDASVALATPAVAGDEELYVNATIGHGGYLVVFEGSTSGRRIGTFYVPPGTYTNQSVGVFDPLVGGEELVVAVFRESSAGTGFDPGVDEPYTRNGSPVTTTVTVRWETPTRTPSPTPTASPSQTRTVTPTKHPTLTPTPTPTATPGLGVLAALLAVTVAALAIRRR